MIKTLFATLRGDMAFIVLVIVAAVGAWQYVEAGQARADRDDVLHRVEIICAGSGAPFPGTGKVQRGMACADQVAGLVRFKANSDQLAAKTLAEALAQHDARQNDDTRAARAAAEAASSAAQRMEIADANAERTNLVDRDWFRAVNGVAGLRPAR
jgi:hypothetical protein